MDVTQWAVDGLDAITWRGLPLQAALLPVAALLGFTVLFSAVGLARLQWEEYGAGRVDEPGLPPTCA